MESRVDTFQKKLAAVSTENAFNPTQGPSYAELNQRKMDKKQKEIEAKRYLDQQVTAKQALKAQQKLEQGKEYHLIKEEVENYKLEMNKKKMELINRNREHLE